MTLITPLPNGAATTGREIQDFAINMGDTRDNVLDLQEKTKNLKSLVEAAKWSLEQVSEVKDEASDFLATVKSMQFSLKLAGKVGPLKVPAKAMERVLERLEDVAESIRDKARSLERKIENGRYIERLETTENRLEGFEAGLAETESRLGNYESAARAMVLAFDFVGAPLDGLENAANAATRPINDILVPLNRTYDAIEAELQGFDDAFAVANGAGSIFDALQDVSRAFGDINGALSFLSGPLKTVQSALKPVEWLLDAAGFIFNITVGPVIDFLLDKLGINRVLDSIGDRIAALLPNANVLDALDARITAVFDQLGEFLGGWDADLDGLVGDITDDVLNALGSLSPDAIKFGTDGAEILHGRTAGLDLLSGLEGNDTIYGYGSGANPASATAGDIFLASSGDDFNYGGAGTDWLLLRGSLSEYRISQFSATAPVVFVHLGGLWGREVAEGIENYVFNDGIFTLADLRARNLLSAPQTNGNDLIVGGTGDDVFVTLRGRDTVFGGGGNDTWLLPDGADAGSAEVWLQAAITDPSGGRHDGYAWDGRERDYLNSIENATVEANRDARLFGSDGANTLITSRADDYLIGGGGNDRLYAGDGRDILIGGAGRDTLSGGAANDTLIAGPALPGQGEHYDGGGGEDRLVYSTRSSDYDLSPRDGPPINGYLVPSGPLHINVANGVIHHMRDGAVIATDRAFGIETYIASDSNDTLVGAARDGDIRWRMDGGGGDDLLVTNGIDQAAGGAGDDMIIMTVSGSHVEGGGGFDTLDLRQLEDTRWSIRNSFNQTIRFEGYADYETEGLGSDNALSGNTAINRLYSGTFEGIDRLLLSNGNDEFYAAGTARIEIFGAGGNDRLIRHFSNDGSPSAIFHGGDGDDYLELRLGGELYGDAGNDEFYLGASGQDHIVSGGTGDDFFVIDRMRGRLEGGEGYDVASFENGFGGLSNVDLLAGIGNFENLDRNGFWTDQIRLTHISGIETLIGGDVVLDRLWGDNDGQQLLGRGGNDFLNGRGGNDELFGGAGNDNLNGGDGNDILHGGAGNDTIVGGSDPDEIDTVSYANARPDGRRGEIMAGDFGRVTVDLVLGIAQGAQGFDVLRGIENVIGSKGDDVLLGDDRRNVLTGGEGADRIEGRGGDDILVLSGDDLALGGDGNDVIAAGVGNATVDGGAGFDHLDFGAVEGNLRVSFSQGTYSGRLLDTVPVWRAGGGTEGRAWNGTILTPRDVIETEAAFANSFDDLSRVLPDQQDAAVGDTVADRFEVVSAAVPVQVAGVMQRIEWVSTGIGNDVVHGTRTQQRIETGAGHDLIGAQAVDNAVETPEGQVFRLYQAAFNRGPDAGGFAGWVDRLETGSFTQQEIAARFVSSPEFQATYGPLGNQAFVQLLYVNALGRTADPTGLAAWTRLLDDGTSRATVVTRFSESLELKGKTADKVGLYAEAGEDPVWNDEVFRLYQAMLDRAPDVGGLQAWAARLGDGASMQEVSGGFFNSVEFQTRYGSLDDRGYITQLYRNVLDRTPGANEVAAWQQNLDTGMSRAEVALRFSQSREFQNNSQPLFLDYMRATPGDRIEGGAGNDTILGSGLADTFVFDADDPGRDTVLQIEVWDRLQFRDFGYASANEALAQMRQVGRDVVFTDDDVQIVFWGTDLGTMADVTILV